MTWSYAIPAGTPAHVADHLGHDVDATGIAATFTESTARDEVVSQITAAVEAARHIVLSGALGDESAIIAGSLTGHANPGHREQTAWVHDQISLSLYQVRA